MFYIYSGEVNATEMVVVGEGWMGMGTGGTEVGVPSLRYNKRSDPVGNGRYIFRKRGVIYRSWSCHLLTGLYLRHEMVFLCYL